MKISFKNSCLILCCTLLFLSCTHDKKLPDEIASIPVTIAVARFDQAFANATISNWKNLKQQYPYLFPEGYTDDFWAEKLSDTIQLEINQEVNQVFPESTLLNEELSKFYKHVTYYYPDAIVPKVITITSERDYRNRAILTDTLLILALDNYLGEDHHFYSDIPVYQAKNLKKEHIIIDVATAFAKTKVPSPHTFSFMEAMIYEGKQLYMMEQLLTLKPKHEIFGYTPEEYQFAVDREVNIWEYFVGKELLFSTDRKLLNRFINPAPFSKFYLEFDNETPGRLGRYIGYKIVASYMKKNKLPLKTMLTQNAETIFNNAKYKP